MINVQENVLLKEYTTFKIGGKAKYFVVARGLMELMEAILFAREKKIPFFVLGGGANILVSDEGYQGLVIKNEMKKRICVEASYGTNIVILGAGEEWDDAVAYTISKNLYGLENLSGIPGTVGACPVQNIGAYGQEIKNVLCSLKAIDSETGEERIFTNSDCEFSYRNSIFKRKEYRKYIIVEVSFLLKKHTETNIGYKDLQLYFLAKNMQKPALDVVRKAVLEIRANKFPDLETHGLAGSYFKNPIVTQDKFNELKSEYPAMPGFPEGEGLVKIPLAWILDNVCKLKGHIEGKVGLFERQPIILVNYGGATADEVKTFSDKIKKIVLEKVGLVVEEEVELIK